MLGKVGVAPEQFGAPRRRDRRRVDRREAVETAQPALHIVVGRARGEWVGQRQPHQRARSSALPRRDVVGDALVGDKPASRGAYHVQRAQPRRLVRQRTSKLGTDVLRHAREPRWILVDPLLPVEAVDEAQDAHGCVGGAHGAPKIVRFTVLTAAPVEDQHSVLLISEARRQCHTGKVGRVEQILALELIDQKVGPFGVGHRRAAPRPRKYPCRRRQDRPAARRCCQPSPRGRSSVQMTVASHAERRYAANRGREQQQVPAACT
mmetsp:Transcript_21185/g.71594  ORF Transcript_21185/g.71594 Transcript_21185/m.71594 type:complete len:264 (-) Transcript_21185:30-821(-)